MFIDSTKCKARNAEEENFQKAFTESFIEIVKRYNLPINHIRYGRQVKSWGSSSVARYHVYYYNNDPTKVELWVNMHKADLSIEGIKYLEWSAIFGCLNKKLDKSVDVTEEDLSAFALKYKYKNNKQLKKYLTRRKAADAIAGTNFAMFDADREEALKE